MNALMMIIVLATPKGGAVFDRCEHCHFATDWRTIRPTSTFDHDPTGFPLRAGHIGITCNQCHGATALTNSACGQCHTDVHSGENGARCDACHDSRTWRIPQARVQHRRTRLPLVGRHAAVACRDCHPRVAEDTWRAVPSDCESCHLAEATAIKHPDHSAFLQRCEDCHTPYGWLPARVAHGRFWPLTGAHRSMACAGCHLDQRFTGTPRDCAACHQADFARGHAPGEDQNCADCHPTTTWELQGQASLSRAGFRGHDAHFPVPHRGVFECGECHPKNTASFTCQICHAHRRKAMDHEHAGVPGYFFEAEGCVRCHPRGSK